MGIHFCDRCNASVPDSDLVAGRAVSTSGRVVCKVCRREISGRSFDEEVHFCDGCNVSISISEIRSGAAFFREGQLLCPVCIAPEDAVHRIATPKPAIVPDRPQDRPATGNPSSRRSLQLVGSLLFLAAVLMLTVGIWFYPEIRSIWRPPESSPLAANETVAADAAAPAETDSLDDSLKTIEGRLGGMEIAINRLSARVDRLGDGASSVPNTTKDWATELTKLESSMTRLNEENRSSFSNDLNELRTSMGDVHSALEHLTARLQALESGLSQPESAEKPKEPVAQAGEGPGAKPDVDEDVEKLLERLKSPEAGQRFSAVVDLGRRRLLECIPAIGDVLLTDDDFVVREYAANVLGNFGDPSGVPFLIAALRDDSPAVVLSADDALRRITKRDSGMKRHMTPQARAEVIRKWESWWEKNQDDYR